MDIYRETILDHYKSPRNFGRLKKPDASGEEHNLSCGDKIGIDIIFSGDKRRISNIKFWGEGCAISIASASLLTETVKGKGKNAVSRLNKDDVIELLGTNLTPTRLKCALLPLEVIQKTVLSF